MDPNEEEFDFVASLLLGGDEAEEPETAADAELDRALAILAPGKYDSPLGLPKQSKATAAYARLGRALHLEKAKTAKLEETIQNMKNRFLTCSDAGLCTLPACAGVYTCSATLLRSKVCRGGPSG